MGNADLRQLAAIEDVTFEAVAESVATPSTPPDWRRRRNG
jgi:hypothetical protein